MTRILNLRPLNFIVKYFMKDFNNVQFIGVNGL